MDNAIGFTDEINNKGGSVSSPRTKEAGRFSSDKNPELRNAFEMTQAIKVGDFGQVACIVARYRDYPELLSDVCTVAQKEIGQYGFNIQLGQNTEIDEHRYALIRVADMQQFALSKKGVSVSNFVHYFKTNANPPAELEF